MAGCGQSTAPEVPTTEATAAPTKAATAPTEAPQPYTETGTTYDEETGTTTTTETTYSPDGVMLHYREETYNENQLCIYWEERDYDSEKDLCKGKWEHYYENGPVASAREYLSNQDCSVVYESQYISYNEDGSVSSRQDQTFDWENNVSTMRNTPTDPRYTSYETVSWYDEDMNLIKEVSTYPSMKDTTVYHNNTQGKPEWSHSVVEEERGWQETTYYTYNEEGQVSKEISWFVPDDDSYKNKTVATYVYNAEGWIIEKTEVITSSDSPDSEEHVYTYEYYENGQRKKEIIVWKVPGWEDIRTVHEYDINGNLISETGEGI